MANKMLIDATHPEETRVVVLRGNRVEEFDFETASRKQLRGNIYLAKVTRVEPSLQAAFVEYGGNRHGFLAFSEIHPDYYQIPVADRQALIEDDARAARESEGDDDQHRGGRRHRGRNRHRERAYSRRDEMMQSDALAAEAPAAEPVASEATDIAPDVTAPDVVTNDTSSGNTTEAYADSPEQGPRSDVEAPAETAESDASPAPTESAAPAEPSADEETHPEFAVEALVETMPDAPREDAATPEIQASAETDRAAEDGSGNGNGTDNGHADEEEEMVESVGGADAMEEVPDRAPRYRRQYKIQEVIKRRQVMLVQVVKEERGTKGAALTTYLSLAGRYCVLMPNTARGGGISRKITSAEDRKKLREIAEELEVPEGMGVILRTAGAARTKAEVKRDFEYLLRLWEQVRDLTLRSTAPTLVYEEGSLAKRSIRDLYTKDIDEIVVAGEQGYRDAKEFMRMLMPSHAKNVKLYQDAQPIFTRYAIESQLDAMFSPTVQLRSGGYIVLNQTEALVSIDVNSGRSTREHHIEDTALKTNVEAAEEIARQLRLRDLAGLIVIDFIDMDEKRNNRTVERKLKDALRNDRARIQVGRISHFGLMEMSRQRIRTSVLESSTEKCPHCGGTGHVRSVSSVSLQLLRSLEETLLKGPTHNLTIRTRPEIALYVLNQKRAHLRELEQRFHVALTINADAEVGGQTGFVIERGEQVMSVDQAKALLAQQADAAPPLIEEEEPEAIDENEAVVDQGDEGPEQIAEETEARAEADHHGEMAHEGGRGRRRRRRRGRGGRGGEGREGHFPPPHQEGGEFRQESAHEFGSAGAAEIAGGDVPAEHGLAPRAEANEFRGNGHGEGNGEHRRRRGRRGGRRNRRGREHANGDFDATQGQELHERPDYSERPEWTPPAEANVGDSMRAQAPSETPRETPQDAQRVVPSPEQAPPPAAVEPPSRRRSTVREPAPMFSAGAPTVTSMPAPQSAAPAPTPESVVTSTAADEQANRPRRTGWWAKRFLGGDKG